MKVYKAASLRGTVNLPGDKSISHRAALLAAMADGESRITNFASSEDCSATLKCVGELGVPVERRDAEVLVFGVGKNGFRKPANALDCQNSGTTMRLMSGILSGQAFDSVLDGDESLRKRPMKRVIGPLGRMGAVIDSNDGRAPLTINGRRPLKSIDLKLEIASAQLKSCVLLAGLNANGTTTVLEPVATRDHTERMLEYFGVQLGRERVSDGIRISVSGGERLTARHISVPGDVSSAAFFLTAAAFCKGSEITMPNVGINPTRSAVLDALQRFGADITISDRREVCGEPTATLSVNGGRRRISERVILKGELIPNLIDELPILAVAGTQLEHGLEIRDAGELRHKESDRIAAVAENLRRMGARIKEFEDGMLVEKSDLKGSTIDSFSDHRIAMAFAIAGLFADGETEIDGAECASVSFPEFFEILERLVN